MFRIHQTEKKSIKSVKGVKKVSSLVSGFKDNTRNANFEVDSIPLLPE